MNSPSIGTINSKRIGSSMPSPKQKPLPLLSPQPKPQSVQAIPDPSKPQQGGPIPPPPPPMPGTLLATSAPQLSVQKSTIQTAVKKEKLPSGVIIQRAPPARSTNEDLFDSIRNFKGFNKKPSVPPSKNHKKSSSSSINNFTRSFKQCYNNEACIFQ
jgi:hypothetical protein